MPGWGHNIILIILEKGERCQVIILGGVLLFAFWWYSAYIIKLSRYRLLRRMDFRMSSLQLSKALSSTSITASPL